MLEEKQGFPQIIEEVAAWFDPAAIFRIQGYGLSLVQGSGREQPGFRVGAAKDPGRNVGTKELWIKTIHAKKSKKIVSITLYAKIFYLYLPSVYRT